MAFRFFQEQDRVRLKPWGDELAVLGFFFVATLCAFSGIVRGTECIWGDFMTAYVPFHHYAVERLQSGQLPFWNPYWDAGMPFLGESDHGTWYPLSFLLLLFHGDPERMFNGLQWFTVMHVWWGMVGMYIFLRSLVRSRLAAVVSGLTYALGGIFIARMGHVSFVCAQSWVPLVCMGLWHAVRGGGARSVALGSLALGMVALSGSPGTLAVLMVGLPALAIGVMLTAPVVRPARRSIARGLGTLAAIMGLGLLIGGVQLIPLTEFVLASERTAYSFKDLMTYSMPPFGLIMLLIPRFFGWLLYHTPGYWGPQNFVELSGYTGLASLGLAVIALRFQSWRETVPWAVLAALGVLLALGSKGGLYLLLYNYLPLFQIARAPGRFLLLWGIGVSVLAGWGTQAFVARFADRGRQGAFLRWWVALLCLLGVFLLLLKTTLPGHAGKVESWWRPMYAEALSRSSLSAGCAAGALGLLWLTPGGGALLGAGAAVCTAGDLILQGQGVGMLPTRLRGPLSGTPVERFVQEDPSLFRVTYPHRPPSRPMLAKLQSIEGTARHLLHYNEFTGRIASNYSPLLDLLNVKYMIQLENGAHEYRSPNLLRWPQVWLFAEERSMEFPLKAEVRIVGVEMVTALQPHASAAQDALVAEVILEEPSGHEIRLPVKFDAERAGLFLDRSATAVVKDPHRIWAAANPHWRYVSTRAVLPPTAISHVRVEHAGNALGFSLKEFYLHVDPSTDRLWTPVYTELQASGSSWNVYENTRVMPRAFLVRRAATVGSREEALERVHTRTFDPRAEVVLEMSPDQLPVKDEDLLLADSAFPGTVDITEHTPERLMLSADVSSPGAWLVLGEVDYPGWRVVDNGVPSRIVRADALLRAVWLTPGMHTVVFRYLPWSFLLGAGCTVLGVLALCALLWNDARRARRARRADGTALGLSLRRRSAVFDRRRRVVLYGALAFLWGVSALTLMWHQGSRLWRTLRLPAEARHLEVPDESPSRTLALLSAAQRLLQSDDALIVLYTEGDIVGHFLSYRLAYERYPARVLECPVPSSEDQDVSAEGAPDALFDSSARQLLDEALARVEPDRRVGLLVVGPSSIAPGDPFRLLEDVSEQDRLYLREGE